MPVLSGLIMKSCKKNSSMARRREQEKQKLTLADLVFNRDVAGIVNLFRPTPHHDKSHKYTVISPISHEYTSLKKNLNKNSIPILYSNL